MPVIWDHKYLQDHTKKQLDALLASYEKAEWQCPKCDTVNPCWNRMTTISGFSNFGTEFQINYYCDKCDYRRKTGKVFNLNGMKPRPKSRAKAAKVLSEKKKSTRTDSKKKSARKPISKKR